jgi:two-component system sensor histidine kinase KdpD
MWTEARPEPACVASDDNEPVRRAVPADAYTLVGGNLISVLEVPREQASSYGVIAPGARDGARISSRWSKRMAARKPKRCWGQEIVARREVEYRGPTLTEMDLDAVLRRAPALALVDEYAHTNVEGSRMERLAAGLGQVDRLWRRLGADRGEDAACKIC